MELLLDKILKLDKEFEELYLRQDEDGRTYIRTYGETHSFCMDIVFYDAILRGHFRPEEEVFACCVNNEEGLSYITFKQQAPGETEEVQISLFFSDVKEEVIPYNYTKNNSCRELGYNPWQVIAQHVWSVHDKITICGEELANEKEKMLAELVNFRPLMQYIGYGGKSENEERASERFLSYIAAVGEQDGPVLEKLEQEVSRYNKAQDKKERRRVQRKIVALLAKKEMRPLFIRILGEFEEAASGYTSYIEANLERDAIESARKEIHDAIISNGFTGEYPYYYKAGEIKGIHLVKGIQDAFIVWNEKEVGMYLRVLEDVTVVDDSSDESSMLRVTFEGARAVLKKKFAAEVTEHRIETAYYEPGYLSIIHHEGAVIAQRSEGVEDFPVITNKLINRVVKTLECKKIEKEESKDTILHESTTESRVVDMLMYGLLGILFSAIMTMAFILIGAVVLLIGKQGMGGVVDMLTEFPWIRMFCFMATGFGGSSYLVARLEK